MLFVCVGSTGFYDVIASAWLGNCLATHCNCLAFGKMTQYLHEVGRLNWYRFGFQQRDIESKNVNNFGSAAAVVVYTMLEMLDV